MQGPHQDSSPAGTEPLEWQISVPIFRNSIILKQLAIAIGIPFGLVALVVILAAGLEWRYAFYALGTIAALFLVSCLLIMALYGGKYAAGYKIDPKGILNYTQKRQAKRNRAVNGLTVILGLATGKPGAAGAGMLAQARQTAFLKWRDIRRVKYNPEQHTIMLRGSLLESMAVFCTAENYEQVQAYIAANVRV